MFQWYYHHYVDDITKHMTWNNIHCNIKDDDDDFYGASKIHAEATTCPMRLKREKTW